jgi:hypothetical protein
MEHLLGPILDRLLALPVNIKPSWKGTPQTNTLAYFASLAMMNKNKFFNFETCGQCYKTFNIRNLGMFVVS